MWRRICACALALVAFAGSLEAEPASDSTEKKVLFVAAKIKDLAPDHYFWAAELAALRLKGKNEAIPGDFVTGLKQARDNPDVVGGVVEIMIDVYSYREEVRITCFDPQGNELWKEKTNTNSGGSEEALSRSMLDKAIKRAQKRPVCGSAN